MKTEEPTREDEPESSPVKEARAEESVNGTGPRPEGVGVAGAKEPYREGARIAPELAPPRPSRILRLVYWAVWFVLLPIVLACILVWALTPPSGSEVGGLLGWIESLVRAQPVPVGIVLFTVFEIVLWAARLQLPLAKHAHPPLRTDLPPQMRGPFERARALLDEAEMILTRNEKGIVRELTAKERDRLRGELDALRESMESVPFDEEAFMDALSKADGEIDVRLGRWRKSEVREYVEAIAMAVAVAFALRAFVIEAFKIPSADSPQ